MTSRFKLTWFLVALLFGYALNETNLHFIKQYNPTNQKLNNTSTVYGYTVWNIDNAWYLIQIKNILAGNDYTLNPDDPRFKVRRTPGYPLFYGLHYVLFGEKNSFFFIRYTQLILNAVSVILLGLAVLYMTRNASWARNTVRLYAFSPFTMIYSYFTLTESLFPFFVILSLYFFCRAVDRNNPSLFFVTGIIVSVTMMVRPITAFILPVFIVVLFVRYWTTQRSIIIPATKMLWMIAGFSILHSAWVVRNYLVTKGEIVLLEKWYDEFEPGHGDAVYAFLNWGTCWSSRYEKQQEYIAHMEKYFYNFPDSSGKTLVREYLTALPPYAFYGTHYPELEATLVSLNDCKHEKNIRRVRMIGGLSNEDHRVVNVDCTPAVAQKLNILAEKYRKANPWRYYIITPIYRLKDFMIHSFSSAFGVLQPKGSELTSVQYGAKALLYMLNMLLIFSFFIFTFLHTPAHIRLLVGLFPVIILIFFVWIYKFIEQRYLLPVHPFFYVALAYLAVKLHEKILFFSRGIKG